MKIVCVYHRIDEDGWMSAAIVKHWFNETNFKKPAIGKTLPDTIDFKGFHYGDPIPDLLKYDKVIMCDISFPKEEMLSINKRLGENFIWIDHHQRTIDEVNAYIIEHGIPMEGLVTEPGELMAACEFTWQYFFPDETMSEIVRLLGRYDCFGHKGTAEELKVMEFQYGARQCISNYEEAYDKLIQCARVKESEYWRLQAQVIVSQILEQGKAIYQYLCTEAKQPYKNGFEIELLEPAIGLVQYGATTRKFICINKERFNPINFGIDYHKDGYDGVASFYRTADGNWSFSLYNDNGLVDCSQIAKSLGGGGHRGASGFIVKDLSEVIK